LSRLRARAELVEVRAAELRFTTDEAEVFLNEVMGLGLEPALVAALEARTEGWAAGLQLAAVSARAHAGAADAAENGLLGDAVRHSMASGDHEHAADLVELSLADMRRGRQDRILREWLVALPEDVVRRRPLLAMFMGWSRLSAGDFDAVEGWLDAAEAGLGATPPLTVGTAGTLAEAVRDREAEVRSTSAPLWTRSPRRSRACTRPVWSQTSWARPSCWRTCGSTHRRATSTSPLLADREADATSACSSP